MTIEQAQRVLIAHPEIELAYVFGSVAQKRARPESDVDVAVQAAKPLDTALRMQLIEELALATGRPVDLIDLRTAGEPLLGQVLKCGERIIGSSTAHVDLMSRHVYAMEDFVPYVRRMLEERMDALIYRPQTRFVAALPLTDARQMPRYCRHACCQPRPAGYRSAQPEPHRPALR